MAQIDRVHGKYKIQPRLYKIELGLHSQGRIVGVRGWWHVEARKLLPEGHYPLQELKDTCPLCALRAHP